jgi:hypothetical protein
MAFIKRDVKDRVVQYPRRYQLVEVQPSIFDLIPVTGTVIEEGTPVNKELLQRYEDGISDLDAKVVAHKADSMPHKFVDGVTTYRWAFRTLNGQPQFIYEEVVE